MGRNECAVFWENFDLGGSPEGRWYELFPGHWAHFVSPPSEEDLAEHRLWHAERFERDAKQLQVNRLDDDEAMWLTELAAAIRRMLPESYPPKGR